MDYSKTASEFEKHGWYVSEDGEHLNKLGVHPYLSIAGDGAVIVRSFSDPTDYLEVVKLNGDYAKDIHAIAECMKRKQRAFLEEAKKDLEQAESMKNLADTAAYWLDKYESYGKETKEVESCL